MKKYDQYKNSSMEWLGEIPKHWELKKLKYSTYIYNGDSLNETKKTKFESDNLNDLAYISSKDIDLDTSNITYENGLRIPQNESKYKVAPKESSLICIEGGSAGRKIAFSNQDICFVNKLACVKAKNNVNSKFIYHTLKGSLFQTQFKLSMSGMIGGVAISSINNFYILNPPIQEQTKIVNFLDDKTTKIDQAIAIKQGQIELLKERRQILIHKALTKGINSEAKLVETNEEWIGKIPEHWDYLKVKNIFKLIIEPAPKDNDFELLSVYTEIGVKPRAELEERGNKASTTDGYWLVKKGDIIVNKLLAWMGAIGISDYDGVTSPAYDILRAKKPIDGYFYHNLFRMTSCKFELKKHSRGIMDMRLRLYFDKFGDVRVPYPPIEEQKEIVNHINLISQKIDSAISLKEQEIEKLKEYKMSLIDGVVTGKVKVC